MNVPFVYEYLFRGWGDHPDDKPNAFHVVIGTNIEIAGEVRTVESLPLTPLQAEALGFDLAAIEANIDLSVTRELEGVRDQLEAVTTELTTAQSIIASKDEEIENLRSMLTSNE